MLAVSVKNHHIFKAALEPMTQPSFDRFAFAADFAVCTTTSAPAVRAFAAVASVEPSSITST